MQGATAEVPKPRPPRDIVPRSFAFAVRALRVVDALPRRTSGFVLGRQSARSATSVGANIEEAQAAHSRPEFIGKMNIARSEAREARYWLRLIVETELLSVERLAEIWTRQTRSSAS